MANEGSFSTATGVDFNLVAYYSYTQNVSDNTSNVTVTLKLRHRSLGATALSDSYLSVAGNKVSYSGKYITQSSNTLTETLLASKTVAVKHASDGKGSCVIKATFVLNGSYSGKPIGTLTLSNTLTLKTIPRASGLSVPSSVNTGSSLTVSINPTSNSFKHKVQFIIGGTTKYTSDFIPAGTTSKSYNIAHSWSPDNPSKTMTVRLYTYNSDGTFIASADKTTTINVPSNIIPKINSVSTSLITGLDGNYVQNKSKIKLEVHATAGDGSSLTTYYYSGKNISGNNTSCSSTSTTQTSSVIQSSGALTYQVRVKDARGRYSAWQPVNIVVQPYSTPKITSIKAQRCLSDGTLDNDGTYAKVTVKTSHASVNNANTASVVLSCSKDNYASSTPIIASTQSSNTYSNRYGSNFAINNVYTIKATITDEYGATHTKTATLKVAQRSLNIAKYGNGVAIGGLSTVENKEDAGKFECNWDATFSDTITALRGRFTAETDIAGSEQNNAPLRVGNASSSHMDFDTNEIISKDNPTTVGRLNIMGYPLQFYLGDGNRVMYLNSDETSSYIRSETTYNRTYDASPNMYITSNGVFGRATSSSQRYKTDIKDVTDEELNPYKILQIPVRQYKYNKDNLPIGKQENDIYLGMIAEEVAECYPAAAEYNEDGQVEMWNIKVIVPALLKIVQDQQKEIQNLKEQLKLIINQEETRE